MVISRYSITLSHADGSMGKVDDCNGKTNSKGGTTNGGRSKLGWILRIYLTNRGRLFTDSASVVLVHSTIKLKGKRHVAKKT
jgi:hypothetical protein